MVKVVFSKEEMYEINVKTIKDRGVTIDDIAQIAYNQQERYTNDIVYEDVVDSVKKILSLRNVFHNIQLGAKIDKLAEDGTIDGPIGDILRNDLGLFGIDELCGLNVAGIYGTIGQTNFGDIDVNKPGIVSILNESAKQKGVCHTFLDDVIGGVAAAASTRIAQVYNEKRAHEEID